MTEQPAIYRGFKDKIEDGDSKNIFRHKSRSPIDTNQHVHEFADNWFNDRFKIFARSQTVICSTDMDQALRYKSPTGSIAEIIPRGSYKIIYSRNVKDFIDYAIEIDEISESHVDRWLQSKNYQCVADIKLIPINFKGEIMVDCEEFFVRNV